MGVESHIGVTIIAMRKVAVGRTDASLGQDSS